jgi:hypothetical protein
MRSELCSTDATTDRKELSKADQKLRHVTVRPATYRLWQKLCIREREGMVLLAEVRSSKHDEAADRLFRGSQTVGHAPGWPSGGASCLYEEHIYFERNMKYKL